MTRKASVDSSEATLYASSEENQGCRSPSTMTPDLEQQLTPDCVREPACPFSGAEKATCNEPPALPHKLGPIGNACLHLTPAFFSLNMGTGIVSILLHGLPYNAEWLRVIATIIFVFNVVLFVLFTIGSIVRYIWWQGVFKALGHHLFAGMFWGCLPMGLATIINMIALVCAPAWGKRWAQLALGLWWIDVVLSILINFGMIFMIFARHTRSLESMTSPLLLPVVTSVVAAASGGVVSNALMPFDPVLARSTLAVSYVVWGTGVPVAMFLITIWILHVAVHGVADPVKLPSLFLPLGPCGQGSFGIVLLGSVVRELAYEHHIGFTVSPSTGESVAASIRVADGIYAFGLVTGLVIWGLGLVWYTLGMVITIDHAVRNKGYFHPRSFAISWTAYTFPIGVWATATVQLAKELDSQAFRVIGTVVSLQVTIQWAWVLIMSIHKSWTGEIFAAPELNEFENKRPHLRFGGK